MLFWIIGGALATAVAALLALAILRGRAGAASPAAYDLQVYRDQLAEVERDRARGAVAEADAERIKAEVSRRILAADAQLQGTAAGAGQQPAAPARAAAALGALVLIGGSAGLYMALGAPGQPDMGLKARLAAAEEARETRPSQAAAEAELPPSPPRDVAPEFAELMDKLRTAVANRPGDVRGLRLLVRNEANMGNFRAAYAAQEKLLAALGERAGADDYADYAELMIIAAQGYVSPEAEKALVAALRRDPEHGAARYYMGLMAVQPGRPDRAFNVWRALLEEGPADAPWIAPIRDRIGQVAARAGVDYTPPRAAPQAQPPGPGAADMQAAADMTPEERQQMIRGMVEGLSQRLATEGGSAQEWARLIGAYGVLGETGKARQIWAEARETFAGRTQALEVLRAAAARAGVAE